MGVRQHGPAGGGARPRRPALPARALARAAPVVAAAALTAAAALAKEAAFLLPVSAPLLCSRAATAPPRRPARRSRRDGGGARRPCSWLRTVVLGGLGGYGDDSVRPGRVVASAVSYAVAAVSPSQLELLRYPAAARGAARAGGRPRLGGVAREGARGARSLWPALPGSPSALLPVLGLPLDLNNSNGERLMLLPSVGLALAFGALVPERPRPAAAGGARRRGAGRRAALPRRRPQLGPGGRHRRARGAQAAELAPADGTLLVVTLPDSYRSARVFTNSFDVAVSPRGRRCGPRSAGASRCTCATSAPGDPSAPAGGEGSWPRPAGRPRSTSRCCAIPLRWCRAAPTPRRTPATPPPACASARSPPRKGASARPGGVLRRPRYPPPACQMTRNSA